MRRIQSGNVKTALVVEELKVVNVNTPHDDERVQRRSRVESKS